MALWGVAKWWWWRGRAYRQLATTIVAWRRLEFSVKVEDEDEGWKKVIKRNYFFYFCSSWRRPSSFSFWTWKTWRWKVTGAENEWKFLAKKGGKIGEDIWNGEHKTPRPSSPLFHIMLALFKFFREFLSKVDEGKKEIFIIRIVRWVRERREKLELVCGIIIITGENLEWRNNTKTSALSTKMKAAETKS